MIYKGGRVHYDTPVGVLCLESTFPKPPGHVRNPLTFRFPVVCHVLEGINVQRMLFQPSPTMLAPFLEGAQRLEKEGVKAIVGSCGFMALFQKELSDSVRVPVLSSSLMQLPLLRLLHGSRARIGVLTASAAALTPAHFAAAGAVREEHPVKGMEDSPVFSSVILEQTETDMDLEALGGEVQAAAEALCRDHALDALVLECTDLSAFAARVQASVSIPVYDVNSLVEYVAYSVQRTVYPPPARA